MWQTLSRSYGRFFAEFLGDLSLVRLGLLDLITCVGLRYGRKVFNLRSFSWKRAPQYLLPRRVTSLLRLGLCIPDLPKIRPYGTNTNPVMCIVYYTPSLHRNTVRSRNINRVSIQFGFRHLVRTD